MRRLYNILFFVIIEASLSSQQLSHAGNNHEIIYPVVQGYYKYTGSNFENTLPVYEFDDDMVGSFFHQFCDTLDVVQGYDFLVIMPVVGFNSTRFDGDPKDYTLIESQMADSTNVMDAVGAIFLEQDIALIMDNNVDWLSKNHLVKTKDNITIKYGIYNGETRFACVRDDQYTAVVRVLDNGKVEPMLVVEASKNVKSLHCYKSFKWIDAYYKEHGLPAGWGYYDFEGLLRPEKVAQ